tara:strand:- start:995 stop:1243 length:249 start_codon:yes stop_codon:yes gene_type:complete
MKLKIILLAFLLPACSSYSEPNVALKTDSEIHNMNRHEVINAISECQAAGLMPLMIYGRIRVGGRPSPVVLDITCAPQRVKS